MSLLAQGRTAEIYAHEETDKIIKLFRSGFPEEAIRQEFAVSQQVCGLGVDAPRLFHRVLTDQRHGIVYERIEGSTMLRHLTGKPWLVWKLSRTMAELHARLHRIELSDAKGYAWRRLAQELEHQIAAAPLLGEDEKSAVIEALKRLPDGHRLCHGDFHPDNVVLGKKNWVIDWMTGTRGNPAGDAARTLVLLRCAVLPEEMPIVKKCIVQAMRHLIAKVYFTRYSQLSGLSSNQIEAWVLPVAAARLNEWIPQGEKLRLLDVVREKLGKPKRA
ncbi:phosphotransferase family protein [Paenibacillus chartarius]|uniref:Phosphotransferase family protein n=1 Tax=Paenibacillus chartarius TaxID=747481 RepID=A0ABV6DSI7_9BACL